jgi:hypothetical protein
MKPSAIFGGIILAVAINLVAALAPAAVVTFEGFGGNTIIGDESTSNGLGVATSDGFQFTSSGDHFHFGNALIGVPSNGTSILLEDRNYTITMTRVGGGAFNLLSADIGEDVSFSLPATRIDVTGFFIGGGSISTQNPLDGNSSAFQLATFPGFNNVTSVTFHGAGNVSTSINGNGFSLDNIQISNVPEPASVLLMASTVAALGISSLRCRRA